MVGEGSMSGADLEDPALAIPFDYLTHQVVHARDHSLADAVMPDMRGTFRVIMTIAVGAFLKMPNCGPSQSFRHARTLFRRLSSRPDQRRSGSVIHTFGRKYFTPTF